MAGLKAQAVHAKFGPQSLPPRTFIRGLDSNTWVKRHKFNELRLARDTRLREDEEVNRKNIEFATNLFISWDDDGSGVLEADEIIKPLISLGLAPNSDFAVKLLQALDPKSKGQKSESALSITLQDFVKIFRSNKVSEALLNLI